AALRPRVVRDARARLHAASARAETSPCGDATGVRGRDGVRLAPPCGPPGDARVARFDELHDLRLLQLATLLPRSAGARPGVGGRPHQLAARPEPDRGQRAGGAPVAAGAL